MGKGARTREQNAGKSAAMKAQRILEAEKKKRNKFIVSVTAAVLAVVILTSSLIYTFYYANGKYLRDNTVVTSSNVTIDNAMMTYFFRSEYSNFQSMYGDYFYLFTGIDTSVSLKDQIYDSDTGETWFDYILESTQYTVQTMVLLAEAAYDAGIELTQSQLDYIDAAVELADSYYLSDGISKDDIRNALQLSFLAQNYSGAYYASLEYSDAEIEAYYEENINTYRTIDYRTYTIYFDDDAEEDEDSDTVTLTYDEAVDRIEQLEAATDDDEFIEIMSAIIAEQEPSITDEDLTSDVEASLYQEVTYTEDNEFSIWAFDDETELYDSYIVTDEDNAYVKISYLVAEPYRNEERTVDIRNIIISGDFFTNTEDRDEYALEVYNLFLEDPTEENFIALVEEYSGDTSTMTTGGLYEGVAYDFLDEDMADWAFDTERVSGDASIFYTDYSVNITYFVQEGEEDWIEQIISDMQTIDYEAYLTELGDTYLMFYDTETMEDIPG